MSARRSAAARIWRTWAALTLLLVLTTGAAYLPLGRFNIVVALTIAAAKALLVLAIFMELKQSSGLVRAFAVAGFFWLMILLVLTGADYMTRRDAPAPWQAESVREAQ